jgi:hypothetical protein
MNNGQNNCQQQGKESHGDESGTTTANNNYGSSPLTRSASGPRTRQGKERSKYNALKYGVFSKVVVLKDEPKAEFEDMLNGLIDYFHPEGEFEGILVDKLAVQFWRQRRLIIADSKADIRKDAGLVELGYGLDPSPPPWDLYLRYETTIDRSIDRTLTQLERHQRMRLGQSVPPPIKVDVSS